MKLPTKRRTGFQPVSEGRHPCLLFFSSSASWKLALQNRQAGRFPFTLATALCVMTSPAIAAAPQPQVSFTEGASSTWNADWSGVTARTYFLQWSLDLVNWGYAPLMEFGTGLKRSVVNTQGQEKFFLRLRYVDAKNIGSLAEAKAADYDGDGVSNRYEVEVERSDPLDAASHGGDHDQDGLPDGWEREFFGNLTHDGTLHSDGDGLSDAQEWELGTHPLMSDTDGDGAADGIMRQELRYDRIGRLTSSGGGAAGLQAFVTDAVGNVTQSNGLAPGMP